MQQQCYGQHCTNHLQCSGDATMMHNISICVNNHPLFFLSTRSIPLEHHTQFPCYSRDTQEIIIIFSLLIIFPPFVSLEVQSIDITWPSR